MLYLYDQLTTDDYHTPTTPIDSLPLWETVEREQDSVCLPRLSPQQQQSEEEESSKHLSTPIFQFINLDDEPTELERDNASNSNSNSSGANSTAQQITGTSTSSSKVIRSARSKCQSVQSTHPYRRPQSAVSDVGPGMRDVQVPLRFVHHNLIPPTALSSTSPGEGVSASAPVSVTPSAIHSPVTSTSKESTGSVARYETLSFNRDLALFLVTHLKNAGSITLAQLQSQRLPLQNSSTSPLSASLQTQQQQYKKYLIRADTHFEPNTGIFLIILELPGVDKKDVKLSLMTSRHNRIRYLKVWGVLDSLLPVPTAEVLRLYPELCRRERKFGEFSRMFVVPPDLNVSLTLFDLKSDDV